TNASCPPTAIRPTSASSSVIDLFSLAPFPLLPISERYALLGTDAAQARRIASADIAGLLPPNVGLLLHGPDLVLDFSPRPFDRLEFTRMLALADQME